MVSASMIQDWYKPYLWNVFLFLKRLHSTYPMVAETYSANIFFLVSGLGNNSKSHFLNSDANNWGILPVWWLWRPWGTEGCHLEETDGAGFDTGVKGWRVRVEWRRYHSRYSIFITVIPPHTDICDLWLLVASQGLCVYACGSCGLMDSRCWGWVSGWVRVSERGRGGMTHQRGCDHVCTVSSFTEWWANTASSQQCCSVSSTSVRQRSACLPAGVFTRCDILDRVSLTVKIMEQMPGVI